ncbi:p-hydroxybenzoic acid efflux pump subunit AaeB [Pigmentiphaga humi]|uniref:p-hydroxybenzoic acid efflux pump subunit AaeB n=1 Tax=Pigmentiphaga humi TaxID=2478468 RepID=A0A3P4B040_9BURK|nr:FUSC family protein [Pigmentiphaga humi]VCU69669.1 p-hydroxybenzoic acid efflux pump subunit AaeB [Pigmentiphaga humi]
MKFPSSSEALFSLKSYAAAMLALYLSMRIGLSRPFWAMMTAYVVASPLSGAVRSKAAYRIAGTTLGSAMALAAVPLLVNVPELLSLAFALWVGLCLFISLLDRTPRSYLFMLAGYTAALIGFSTVAQPEQIFDISLSRVEEILLGIVCATAVHSLILPQGIGPVLLDRIRRAFGDAERWMTDTLGGKSDVGQQDRRKLAADITDLRLMATHLPFDTSRLRWTSNAMHAVQDRLALVLPLLSAIEDRLAVLGASAAGVPRRWQEAMHGIADWAHGTDRPDPARSAELLHEIEQAIPAATPSAGWRDILEISLGSRLKALIGIYADSHALRMHIETGLHDADSDSIRERPGTSPRALHTDRGLALLSAFAAAVAIMACSLFWIWTAWPAGYGAALMAAIFCCLFATLDNPVPAIRMFLKFTLWSIPCSAVYLLVVLPAVHSFEMLVLTTAPLFLLLGILVARPATTGPAMAFLFGVAGALSLHDTQTADLASFVNGMLAQVAGIVVAAVCTRLFRTISAEHSALRLLRANWKELAQLCRAESVRATTVTEISARMLDRLALLAPRIAAARGTAALQGVDALRDLRVGLNLTQLLRVMPELERQGVSPRPLLRALAGFFDARQQAGQPPSPALLQQGDALLRTLCALPPSCEQRDALAALGGLRRDLHPGADDYQPAPVQAENPHVR